MSQHETKCITVICTRPACSKKITLHKSQLNSRGTKYCSHSCASKHRYVDTKYLLLTCVFSECNSQIRIRESQVSASGKWCCSQKCSGKHKSEIAEYVKLTCSFCGKRFEKLKSQARSKKYGYYCSRKCQYAHKDMHIKKAVRLRKQVEVICAVPGCETTFDMKFYRTERSRRLYCQKHVRVRIHDKESREKLRQVAIARDAVSHLKKVWADPEFRKAFGESRRGAKHPCWNGGSSHKDYDPEFMRTIRYSTKCRDSYRCQLCHVRKKRSELHSHHIDHDKDNSDPMNIVTLCRSCHGRVHRKALRDAWRRVLQNLVVMSA